MGCKFKRNCESSSAFVYVSKQMCKVTLNGKYPIYSRIRPRQVPFRLPFLVWFPPFVNVDIAQKAKSRWLFVIPDILSRQITVARHEPIVLTYSPPELPPRLAYSVLVLNGEPGLVPGQASDMVGTRVPLLIIFSPIHRLPESSIHGSALISNSIPPPLMP